MRILVEGGATLSASLLNEDLIDEIAWFRAQNNGNDGIDAISNLNINRIDHLKKFKLIITNTIEDDQYHLRKN